MIVAAAACAAACLRDTGFPIDEGQPSIIVAGPGAVPRVRAGDDALLAWDRLYELRVGARTILRSTFDRTGGNESSDASHFLRQDAATGHFVALDVAGPGILRFARANQWHGSPWHYVVDGRDYVVSESSTADPDHPVSDSRWLPERAFPSPLALTWSATIGADVSWVSIPFASSLAVEYERTRYGTGYFVVEQVPEGTSDATIPVAAWKWDLDTAPDPRALDLLRHAGDDQAASGEVRSGVVDVPADGAVDLPALEAARPSVLRALRIDAPRASTAALARARLQITWDDRSTPSIDAPVPLFFGSGTLYNRNDVEYLVKSVPASIRFGADRVELASYFAMPFATRARVRIVGAGGEAVPGVHWSTRARALDEPFDGVGYFHATYVDHGRPTLGRDLVFLDTTTVEGGGDWCGTFVGTSFTFSDAAVLGTLEGDPRFFFDDSATPQAQGTGTEEWAAGGDYWSGHTVTLPLAGHPVGAPSPKEAQSPEDAIESAYRFLVADAMPFGKRAVIQFEHGLLDDSAEHYTSVVFWYGRDRGCLAQTDALHVGDAADERAHRYVAVGASDVVSLTSRYELGVDHLDGREIFPPTTDTGRTIATSSEMTLKIDPANLGVLLRRKLDYGFADQRADVFVADDSPGAAFVHAGTWYAAGSNRVVFANAATETGSPTPIVEESNRRWKDDELLIRRQLTQGRSAIRVRVVVAPGRPWTEFRYTAYVWKP